MSTVRGGASGWRAFGHSDQQIVSRGDNRHPPASAETMTTTGNERGIGSRSVSFGEGSEIGTAIVEVNLLARQRSAFRVHRGLRTPPDPQGLRQASPARGESLVVIGSACPLGRTDPDPGDPDGYVVPVHRDPQGSQRMAGTASTERSATNPARSSGRKGAAAKRSSAASPALRGEPRVTCGWLTP